MVEYIIWLKSGECVKGTALEEDIKVLSDFGRKKLHPRYISFADTEGVVAIRTRRIEAVGINTINDSNKLGF